MGEAAADGKSQSRFVGRLCCNLVFSRPSLARRTKLAPSGTFVALAILDVWCDSGWPEGYSR
jgi:hypothetical protein